MIVAFSVLLLACFFQGSFGICFKKYQPFSWEAFWTLFSIIGVLLIPHIWAFIEVPNYMSYIQDTPVDKLFFAASMGFLWGISSIAYSKAIDMIGVSLVTGINLGLSLLLGSFVPMFILGTFPSAQSLTMLILSMVVLMGGVVVLSKAGFMKNDGSQKEEEKNEESSKKSSLFMLGFILALASGAGSAAINIGASAANYPVQLAIDAGISPVSASLLSWVVVFAGGFLANFVYAIVSLVKNKTYTDYTKKGAGKAYFKVVVTSFVWFAALAVYGKATHLLGDLGPIVGWVGFNGLALIIANMWGFRDGEWKGHKKAQKVAIIGNAIIVVSLVFVALANSL
ncbi:MAG: L-rhamnose/proton symporter RhaT [Breznakia sp.]